MKNILKTKYIVPVFIFFGVVLYGGYILFVNFRSASFPLPLSQWSDVCQVAESQEFIDPEIGYAFNLPSNLLACQRTDLPLPGKNIMLWDKDIFPKIKSLGEGLAGQVTIDVDDTLPLNAAGQWVLDGERAVAGILVQVRRLQYYDCVKPLCSAISRKVKLQHNNHVIILEEYGEGVGLFDSFRLIGATQ